MELTAPHHPTAHRQQENVRTERLREGERYGDGAALAHEVWGLGVYSLRTGRRSVEIRYRITSARESKWKEGGDNKKNRIPLVPPRRKPLKIDLDEHASTHLHCPYGRGVVPVLPVRHPRFAAVQRLEFPVKMGVNAAHRENHDQDMI